MQRQRGFLILIVLVFLVMISALYMMAARFMIATSLTLTNQFQEKRAYYLAHGSLEHGLRAYKLNSAYSGDSGTMGGIPYETQVYTTNFTNVPLPLNQKRIRGIGRVGNITRIVEAIVQNPELVVLGDFEAPNCGVNAPWDMALTTSQAPPPNYCAIGAGIILGPPTRIGGNALIMTGSGSPDHQTFATENVGPYTVANSTTFTVNYLYKITKLTGTNGCWVKIWFNKGLSSQLSNQVKYTSVVVWTDGKISITVPANYTLRTFTFQLASGGANGTKTIMGDNVSLLAPGMIYKVIAVRDVLS